MKEDEDEDGEVVVAIVVMRLSECEDLVMRLLA